MATIINCGGGGTVTSCPFPVGFGGFFQTDPNSIYAGTTWEQKKDVFILASGDTYAAGSTGGEAEHLLTTDELPSHTHSLESITGTDDLNFTNGYGAFLLQNSDTTVDWPMAKNAEMKYGNTGSVGGNQPHNNLPPYFAMPFWIRTA